MEKSGVGDQASREPLLSRGDAHVSRGWCYALKLVASTTQAGTVYR
jgi:hypothetical protein